MTIKKEITFGKVAASGGKVKRNLVTLELELKNAEKDKPVFSVCGNVWNHLHTDIIQGGQCVDSIWEEYGKQLKNQVLYKEILRLWIKWHLNDMHAECIHQQAVGMTWKFNPRAKCAICGWELGKGWDYRAINPADLRRMKEIITLD